jgi:hypothetical protein
VGDVSKGIESGFIATFVISLLMVAQARTGIAPDFNLIALLMQAAKIPESVSIAWTAHVAIGTVLWGTGFAMLSPHLPGPHWLRGLTFGLLAWVAMMVLFLPAADKPIFAQGLGPTIPVASLGLHLVFGLVLGETYHLLLRTRSNEADSNA